MKNNSNTIRVAFYKCYKGNWLDWLIAVWTSIKLFKWMPYSHVEIVFHNGEAFSSSILDGGVRFKRGINFEDSEKWDVVELELDSWSKEINLYNFCIFFQGAPYDKLGIFLHEFLPLCIQSFKKWWCSEMCTRALQTVIAKLNNYPTRISPNKMYSVLQKYFMSQ
jgi:hypothetical protein